MGAGHGHGWCRREPQREGAYLEVVADTVGSVGVIVAGILVSRTGDGWWDTVVAQLIAGFVAVRAVMLGREVLAVLGVRPDVLVRQARCQHVDSMCTC